MIGTVEGDRNYKNQNFSVSGFENDEDDKADIDYVDNSEDMQERRSDEDLQQG
jgi:hypothetical protein